MTGALGISAAKTVEVIAANNADITHRKLGAGWLAADAIISHQGENAFDVPPMDFHFFELCVDGSFRARNRFAGLHGGPDCTYRPNAMFLIPAGRDVRTEGSAGMATNLQLLIARPAMDAALAEVVRGDPSHERLLGFNEVVDPRMLGIARALHRELILPEAAGALYADSLVQALCALIARGWTTGRHAPEPARPTLSPAQLARALDAIEEGIEENPGLDTVAQAAGFSTFHFARAFKEATGQSPHQYLIERPLTRARQLIDEGMALSEVAYACGFASQAHMTTTFTKILGLSPGKYRESRT